MKPEGFACILAPNSAGEHKHPFDCYRYYADGFSALAKWGGFKIINVTVAGIPDPQAPPEWNDVNNDVMMILLKSDRDDIDLNQFPRLLHERRVVVTNVQQVLMQATVWKG